MSDFFIVGMQWKRQGYSEVMYSVQTMLGTPPDAELLAYAVTVGDGLANFGGTWRDSGRELVIYKD